MEKMRQQECKSEAICSKDDDELDLTLTLGLPNHVRGKNVSNITQPHQKSTQLICSQQAMQKLNFSHDQVMKSCPIVVSESDHNKENVIFSGSSNKQMSWPLMSNQSIMMNSRGLVQIPKAIIKEAPAHSNIMMISTSCNYNMNSTCNRIAYPPKNQMNSDCYIILDPSKKRTRSSSSSSSTFSSSSSKKRKSHTKIKLQSASSGSRRGKSNTEFTDHDREVPGVVKDPNKRCTNYNCGVRFSPMWRRGPLGPKSLCNACGIRFRKQEQKRMEEGSDISCTSTADTY